MSSELSAIIVGSQCLKIQRRGGRLCDADTMSSGVGGATRAYVKGSAELEFQETRPFRLFGAVDQTYQLKLVDVFAKTGEKPYGIQRTAKGNSLNHSKAGVSFAKKTPNYWAIAPGTWTKFRDGL